jgi:hypothetical protein
MIKRKSLHVGINYRGQGGELSGCIGDVQNLVKFLPRDVDAFILTDDTPAKPTRENILNELKKLVANMKSGDISYFQYSGHGSQIRDRNGDEEDGADEVILPIDYATAGVIIDDEIFDIVKKVPRDAWLFCFMDCCHSGTCIDLKYNYGRGASGMLEGPKITNHVETEGNIVMISGCRDNQTSADTIEENPITGKLQAQGAMTWALLKMVSEQKNLTFRSLLNGIYQKIGGFYDQVPQLAFGRNINIDSVFGYLCPQ